MLSFRREAWEASGSETTRVQRRSGEGKTERYGEVARELVNLKPDEVVTSARILAYFREATTTIPIVAITGDPILFGIVSNVSRPEGNVTGFSADASVEIHGKYLEILKEIKPSSSRVWLYSQAPSRSEGKRPPLLYANESATDHQSQNCEVAWPRNPANAARPRQDRLR